MASGERTGTGRKRGAARRKNQQRRMEGRPTGPKRPAGTGGGSGGDGRGPKKYGDRAPGSAPPPRDARDAATRVIERWAARFPDVLPAEPDTEGLDQRDAALAHTLVDVVARRWLTLRFVLATFTRQGFDELESGVRASLLVGAGQLLLLDRLPAHAVLNEAVDWTKRFVNPAAGGLVNAVLRKVADLPTGRRLDAWEDRLDALPLGDGRAVELVEPILPLDPAMRLGLATSLPRSVYDAWCGSFGSATARDLALHGLMGAPTVLNVAHADGPLPESCVAHERDGSAVWAGSIVELRSLLRERRDIWAQDAGSAAALDRLGGEDFGIVVDLCAGRGTKTRQLRAMYPGARLIAAEVDEARLRDLKGLLKQDPKGSAHKANALPKDVSGKADLVLLDVPCSNSGVLARRPEARYRFGSAQARRLADTQREIVRHGASLLGAGGRLMYSTCSLEGIENGAVAAWAASEFGLEIERESTRLPKGVPGDPATRYRDGGYTAVLRKA